MPSNLPWNLGAKFRDPLQHELFRARCASARRAHVPRMHNRIGVRVKVLIYSQAFPPQTGGVERIVMSLARGLARLVRGERGHPLEVTVATLTPAGEMDDSQLPFRVVRRPRLDRLVMLLQAADVVHLAGPALLPLFLGWLMRKRLVVEHHGFQTICPNGQLFMSRTRLFALATLWPRDIWSACSATPNMGRSPPPRCGSLRSRGGVCAKRFPRT